MIEKESRFQRIAFPARFLASSVLTQLSTVCGDGVHRGVGIEQHHPCNLNTLQILPRSVSLPVSVSEVRQFCPNYRRSAVMVFTGVLASNGAIHEVLRPYKPYLTSLAFPACFLGSQGLKFI